MLHTKAEAARLAGISRATLYSHIKEGRITVAEGKIDTSELLRVYGQLKQAEKPSSDDQVNSKLDVLQKQIEFLQEQLRHAHEREKEEREEKRQLLNIVEQQTHLLTHQTTPEPSQDYREHKIFGSWFRRR